MEGWTGACDARRLGEGFRKPCSAAPVAARLACLSPQAMAVCSELRPPVDISVGGDNSSEGVGVGGARTEYKSVVATA
jgi:hypothetical protein